MFIEINLRKKKWLLCVSCNPHKALIGKHLQAVGKNLDLCSGRYENDIIMGDFNTEPIECNGRIYEYISPEKFN